jgi:hypothetical protein
VTSRLGSLLDHQASLLDLSIEEHDAAVRRYTHLAEWLVEHDLGRADRDVYPQGSFRLGTVVKPADGGGDFDIDLVFRRDLDKASTTQDDLKSDTGAALIKYCHAQGLGAPLELGRCWRLEFFDDGFHLDVLPAIPDPEIANGILLSDAELRFWLFSNPIGYADWFYDRMDKTLFEESRASLAKVLAKSVEQVPTFAVRTPLQRIVQLFKRSRDEFFSENLERRPPSILVTTLSAHAYRGQREVLSALLETARAMPQHVERRNGEWWVENPAHSGENFADKWNSDPERREDFIRWLAVLISSLEAASTREGGDVAQALRPAFGMLAVDAASDLAGMRSAQEFRAARGELRAPNEQVIEELFPVDIRYGVRIESIVAEPSGVNRYARRKAMRRRRLAKGRTIRFQVVDTNVPEPFDVYWKVRNRGVEARRRGDLRGKIERDDGRRRTDETTRYFGDHYVECYVVKSGVCVARTREWVPIA